MSDCLYHDNSDHNHDHATSELIVRGGTAVDGDDYANLKRELYADLREDERVSSGILPIVIIRITRNSLDYDYDYDYDYDTTGKVMVHV